MITFELVTKEEIGRKAHPYGKTTQINNIIYEFIHSENEAIECFYDEEEYANSNNFRKSFQNALDRNKIKNVNVVIRGSRVFLVKKDGLT